METPSVLSLHHWNSYYLTFRDTTRVRLFHRYNLKHMIPRFLNGA